MFEAFAMLVGNKTVFAKEHTPVVPEPEFKPFRFAVSSPEPTPVPLAPRTLEELGVDGSLAKEMEFALWLHGHTKGDRVVGYTFRTPDGVRYALKLGSVPLEKPITRAA
jgi:hypothetical protein